MQSICTYHTAYISPHTIIILYHHVLVNTRTLLATYCWFYVIDQKSAHDYAGRWIIIHYSTFSSMKLVSNFIILSGHSKKINFFSVSRPHTILPAQSFINFTFCSLFLLQLVEQCYKTPIICTSVIWNRLSGIDCSIRLTARVIVTQSFYQSILEYNETGKLC